MRSSGFHMSAIGLALLLASSGRAVAGQADSASDDELRAMKDRFAAAATIRTAQSLSERYAAYEAVMPDWVMHDAVEDWFCEKGSTVRYWRDGRQVELLGAD